MTFTALLVTSVAVYAETPKEALESVIKHYQSLTSYSATIESHDGSGLFPGNYEQTLKWKKGGRFEILVTKKSDYTPKDGIPGGQAPDYFSNGEDVLTRRPDGSKSVRSIVVDRNTSPGWEVTASPLLSWLQKSPTSRFLVEPPEGFKITYEWGSKKDWEGIAVREAALKMEGQGSTLAISLFLSAEKPQLLGYEYMEQGKRHWVRYKDAKENPELPATLGDHPKQLIQFLQ